ncbi:DUF6448 family protein [Geobacter sp. SVR]|uniref:DUF6448 family protein n=1 Tax=Geobacter sp. SVR TaxID=2495594 RepID=UPI00143F00B3|nr:DUF6448 family protein [Geobacter sp. SVR]BCS55405.1 hypothetical protein GSVR_37130 [Geobacter sp. SVR]GCF83407.1 hypothetical protein GSbR_00070 [Geobacter sp. SVR]
MSTTTIKTLGIAMVMLLSAAVPRFASAHCDTLDGPVVMDARKAIEAGDVTPVLKWVKAKDEKAVRAAFGKLLASRGKHPEAADKQFFTTLVKIHRAGEGAPFTGLKPAGAVEPAVAEADEALAGGSPGTLVKLIADDVAAGIQRHYERVAAAYRHKDESVAKGREFVEAYVAFTHYVERLHADVIGRGAHGEEHQGKKHPHADHRDGAHADHGAGKQ